MALGEFASLMVHGLGYKGWWLLERTTIAVLASVRLAIFYYPNRLFLVVGERVTFHVRTRLVP